MRMSHTAMVEHLKAGKGGLLIDGQVITNVDQLPPVEQWHKADSIALGDRLAELESQVKELEAKKEKLLDAMTKSTEE